MAQIFTNGEQLRCRFALLVLFVFIRAIRGSRTSGQHERTAWLDIDEVALRVSYTVETTVLPSFALRAVLERGDVWESFSNFREGNLGHAGR